MGGFGPFLLCAFHARKIHRRFCFNVKQSSDAQQVDSVRNEADAWLAEQQPAQRSTGRRVLGCLIAAACRNAE